MDREIRVLKFAYMGVTELIHYVYGQMNFNELLSLVLRAFKIPAVHKKGVILRNARGDKFDRSTFDSKKHNSANIIFIRLDFGKLNALRNDNAKQFKKYKSAPVRRQNCFIGEYPGDTRAQPFNFKDASPPTKRRRLLIHSKKPKNLDNKSMMRL